MPFSSGVFTLYTPGNPPVTGTTISSTWAANTLNDIANNGLSYCILKDGTQTVISNIPFSSFRLTGLGAATARTDAIQYAQVQDNAPAYLTAVAGTNTITASLTGLAAYATGMRVTFLPANTNTGATTLNINSIGGKNIYWNGAALFGGEIVQNVPVTATYDGTQFQIDNPQTPKLTNSISGDVTLNNTGIFFDGPVVAQGTVGLWYFSGTVTFYDTAGGALFKAKLWDGTTVIDSAAFSTGAGSQRGTMTLSGYLAAPAASVKISVNDASSTSGAILFNSSGSSKDSTLTAMRVG